MRWLLIGAVLCGLAGGCASRGARDPATRPAVIAPQSISGIENFAQVSQNLYRGAQPTADGFAQLKQRGIKTVINLRDGFDDRPLMAGLGLRYIEIPTSAWTMGDEEVSQFLKAVEDPANWPVFVHCHRGADRTGCAVAAYRMVNDGWSSDDAIDEMKRFDHAWLYVGIDLCVKGLDTAAMKQRLTMTTPPLVEVVP